MGKYMQQQHRKALVVSPFFATILSSVAVTAVIGGIGYAWNANADLAVLQRDVKQIKDANLDVRISVMEQNIKSGAEAMTRLELRLSRMDDKLDKVLERR